MARTPTIVIKTHKRPIYLFCHFSCEGGTGDSVKVISYVDYSNRPLLRSYLRETLARVLLFCMLEGKQRNPTVRNGTSVATIR